MDEEVCYLVETVLVPTRMIDLLASMFLRIVRSGSACDDGIQQAKNGLVKEEEKVEEKVEE